VPDRIKPSFVIFDIRALCLTFSRVSHERQSARMSKTAYCFVAVLTLQQWASKG